MRLSCGAEDGGMAVTSKGEADIGSSRSLRSSV